MISLPDPKIQHQGHASRWSYCQAKQRGCGRGEISLRHCAPGSSAIHDDITCASSTLFASFDMTAMPSPLRLARTWRSINHSFVCNSCLKSRRSVSTQTATTSENPTSDLVELSSFKTFAPPEDTDSYDPLKSSRGRKRQLPPSR